MNGLKILLIREIYYAALRNNDGINERLKEVIEEYSYHHKLDFNVDEVLNYFLMTFEVPGDRS